MAKKRIENLAREVGVSDKEVWEIVEFVLGDMYCLARDCARDEVVRKFVAPALEMVTLDKALNNEFNRERERCSSSARCMQLQWQETAQWGVG